MPASFADHLPEIAMTPPMSTPAIMVRHIVTPFVPPVAKQTANAPNTVGQEPNIVFAAKPMWNAQHSRTEPNTPMMREG